MIVTIFVALIVYTHTNPIYFVEMGAQKPVFSNLSADEEPEVTEIESLCVHCFKNGKTRMLLTKIPFYKEVVLVSFTCDHCGYQNNEIQSGAQVAEKGIRITVNIKVQVDLNRQVVTSDYTSIKIPEVDFEIPSKSRKGEITTVEGIIDRTINALEQDQPIRMVQNPKEGEKINEFIEKLRSLKNLKDPFTMIVEDISGNTFVENPVAPESDPNTTEIHFVRSKEQDHILGIYTHNEISDDKPKEEEKKSILHPIAEGEFTLEDLENEVLHFGTNCPGCGTVCVTNMKMTNIPHFKEVVIMATVCEACGLKTNEVKSGGGIEEKGLRIEVDIKSKDDFSRDVLKSETCEVKIPELKIEVGPYALGGRFTTVEGLLVAIKDQLRDPKNTHMFGDSQTEDTEKRFEIFLKKIDDILEGKMSITLVLDDPAGNSYIQSMRDDDDPDENLRITRYERTFEQNEELGLNDMKTENYES